VTFVSDWHRAGTNLQVRPGKSRAQRLAAPDGGAKARKNVREDASGLGGVQALGFGRASRKLLCQPGMPLAGIVGHRPLCGRPLFRRTTEVITLI